MKGFLKLMIIGLVLATLLIAACSRPPQPVSQEQYQTAVREAREAETTANSNLQLKKDLEAELSRKEAELRSLRDYERELGL